MSSENVIEYRIFHSDANLLGSIRSHCEDLVSSLGKDYIWQKESFGLSSVEESSGLACLNGSTNVGENINDEWFIVYLLFEISKHHKDTIIQIYDSDGDFLLIEAADYLPSWLTPANSENRVFLKDGKLHFIPIPSNPAEITVYSASTPTLKQAYHLLASSLTTAANENIQNAIQKRISSYPSKFVLEFHHAHCYIPEEVVYVLLKQPKLVAAAVQAFYERDASDVKTCIRMSFFKAETRRLFQVKFTRHLYCQLMQAHFQPEQHSSWRLPLVSNKLRKPAELGYKLTCGFQILLSRVNVADSNGDHVAEPSGKIWEQYMLNLKKNNYFKNEMEGSVLYKDYMNKAKSHFQEYISDNYKGDAVGLLVQKLICEAKDHREEIQVACESIGSEDDDSWMTLTEEELDKMMLNMWGKGHPDTKADQAKNLNTLADNMKSFVEQVSSYEGAESFHGGSKNNEEKQFLDPIQFEPDVFLRTVKNLMESSSETKQKNESDESDEYGSDSDLDPEMIAVMQQMDDELSSTNLQKSFEHIKDDTIGMNNQTLDVDVNLVKNFLESFSNQEGLSGPVSNILQSIGMNLPPNSCET